MWDSPITKVSTDIQTKLAEAEEGKIMMIVEETIGYHVDKEKLIKALNYSKEQYDKGYAEGCDDVYSKIKQAIDEITDESAYFHEIAGDVEYVRGIRFCLYVLNKYFGKEKS